MTKTVFRTMLCVVFAVFASVTSAKAQLSVTFNNPTVQVKTFPVTGGIGFLNGVITVASGYDLQGIAFREPAYNAQNFIINDTNVSSTPEFSSAVAPTGAAGSGLGFSGNILEFNFPASQHLGLYDSDGTGGIPFIRFSARRIRDGRLIFQDVSYGVNVSAGAPEPSAALLLLSGLPVVGVMLRRRKA